MTLSLLHFLYNLVLNHLKNCNSLWILLTNKKSKISLIEQWIYWYFLIFTNVNTTVYGSAKNFPLMFGTSLYYVPLAKTSLTYGLSWASISIFSFCTSAKVCSGLRFEIGKPFTLVRKFWISSSPSCQKKTCNRCNILSFIMISPCK